MSTYYALRSPVTSLRVLQDGPRYILSIEMRNGHCGAISIAAADIDDYILLHADVRRPIATVAGTGNKYTVDFHEHVPDMQQVISDDGYVTTALHVRKLARIGAGI